MCVCVCVCVCMCVYEKSKRLSKKSIDSFILSDYPPNHRRNMCKKFEVTLLFVYYFKVVDSIQKRWSKHAQNMVLSKKRLMLIFYSSLYRNSTKNKLNEIN